MAMHADAVGRLARIDQELEQPWRIEQGGPNGGATRTADLVAMHAATHNEIVKAEEMVLKAARLALDERKAQDAAQAPAFSYSGEAEAIAIPTNLSPADREGLRALMGNLTKYVAKGQEARKAITLEATSRAARVSEGVQSAVQPANQPAVQSAEPDPAGADDLTMTTTPAKRRRKKRKPKK